MKRTWLTPLSGAALVLLSGCTTVQGPGAAPPGDLVPSFFAPTHYVDDGFDTGIGNLKGDLGNPLTPNGRDFVGKYLRRIDRNYAAYSSWLSTGRASIDTAYDSTGLAATGLSAISTVTSVKTALAAVGTFSQGQKNSLDKNYYQGKVVHTLVNVMEVSRTELRAKFRRALLRNDYTLQEALFDLEEYYRAGTIDTALSSSSINAATPEPPDKPASSPAAAASAPIVAESAAAENKAKAVAGSATALSDALARVDKRGLSAKSRAEFNTLANNATALARQAQASADGTAVAALAAASAVAAKASAAEAPPRSRPRYPSTSPY
jgi:hypothetical protein